MKSRFWIFLIVLLALLSENLLAQQRIISLASSLTKSLYYLEVQDAVVGVTSYCEEAKNDGKEVVASAIQVNVEKVITMKPDLVLVHSITKPQTVALLKKAGLNVKVFNTPRSFDDVCNQFLELGEIVGKKELSHKIVDDVKVQVDSIKGSYQNESAKKILMQIGAKPIFTALDNTYMSDFISFSGGVNIAVGLSAGVITREFVLMQNPDVIIVVNMGVTGEDEVATWKSYPQLSASKREKIFIIDSDMASTPNPVDFLKTMKVLRENM